MSPAPWGHGALHSSSLEHRGSCLVPSGAVAAWEGAGCAQDRSRTLCRGHNSRGVGVLQEAELVALAVGAQGLHDRQDPGRGERGRRVESWSQQESAEQAKEGAEAEGGRGEVGGHRRDRHSVQRSVRWAL